MAGYFLDTVDIGPFMLVTDAYYQNYYAKMEWEVNSVDNSIVKSHATVFPNPASDQLFITADYQIDKLALINMNGSIILEEEINAFKSVLNVKDVPEGLYFLQSMSADGIKNQKVIIER